MYQIPVYRAEREAGLEELVRTTSALAFVSAVRPAERFELTESVVASLAERARGGVADSDLHYLDTVLATVGWNKNDDVFDPVETWLARKTPEHKPVNFEHDCSRIVGHIISNSVIDAEGKVVADETVVEDLPGKFHVLTGAVLYKVWEDKKLQEVMDRTLAEIAKGEWFVSMECLFRGFDYALIGDDGSHKVVARNDQTAFLTKHLKAYKGTGTYEGYKVGRLLRNIVFSGKGLVRNPANPESVILGGETQPFSPAKAGVVQDFSRVSASGVYSTSVQDSQQEKIKVEITVADLQKQLDALRAENEQLKSSGLTKARDEASAKAAELQKQLDDAKAGADKVVAELEAAKAKLAETESKLAEAGKSLADVKDELRGIYEEQKKTVRLAKVMAALKVKADDAEQVKAAETLTASLADKTDEQFEAHLTAIAKFAPAQETPKPTPAAKPDDGSANADTAILDQVKPDQTVAHSTVAANDGVQVLAKDVAAFFGYAE